MVAPQDQAKLSPRLARRLAEIASKAKTADEFRAEAAKAVALEKRLQKIKPTEQAQSERFQFKPEETAKDPDLLAAMAAQGETPRAGLDVSKYFAQDVAGSAIDLQAQTLKGMALMNRLGSLVLSDKALPKWFKNYFMNKAAVQAAGFDLAYEKIHKAAEEVGSGEEYTGKKFAQAIGSTLGFMAPGMFVGLGARATSLMPVLGDGAIMGLVATQGAMVQGAEQFADAKEHKASDEDAFKSYALALGVGATEVVPIAGWLARINRKTGGSVSWLIKTMAAEGLEEGSQELLQQTLSNTIARAYYDGDRPKLTLDEAIESGGLGFLTGMLFSGAVSIAHGEAEAGPAKPKKQEGVERTSTGQPLVGPSPFLEEPSKKEPAIVGPSPFAAKETKTPEQIRQETGRLPEAEQERALKEDLGSVAKLEAKLEGLPETPKPERAQAPKKIGDVGKQEVRPVEEDMSPLLRAEKAEMEDIRSKPRDEWTETDQRKFMYDALLNSLIEKQGYSEKRARELIKEEAELHPHASHLRPRPPVDEVYLERTRAPKEIGEATGTEVRPVEEPAAGAAETTAPIEQKPTEPAPAATPPTVEAGREPDRFSEALEPFPVPKPLKGLIPEPSKEGGAQILSASDLRHGQRVFSETFGPGEIVGINKETVKLRSPTGREGTARIDQLREPVRDAKAAVKSRYGSEQAADNLTDEQVPDVEHELLVDLTDNWLLRRQAATTESETLAQTATEDLQKISKEEKVPSTDLDEAAQLYIDLKNAEERGFGGAEEQFRLFGDKLTPDQVAKYNLSQNLPPKAKAFADQIAEENRASGIKAAEHGVIHDFYDNYSRRVWKPLDEQRPTSSKGRKFQRSTSAAKQRTYQSILEGWANGRELQVKGAVAAQKSARQEIANVIQDRNLIRVGKKLGFLSSVKREPDWVPIEHPGFYEYVFSGKADPDKAYRPDLAYVNEDGDLFVKAPLYAPPDFGKDMNKILGRTRLQGRLAGFWRNFNARWKQRVLTSSLFHPFAFIRSYSLGGRAINPIKGYYDGHKTMNAMGPELRELYRGGLTTFRRQDWEVFAAQQEGAIDKIINKVAPAKKVRDILRTTMRKQSDYVFNVLGARLKTQAAILEYRHLLRKKSKGLKEGTVTKEEIAREVANLMNNDFGGLNLELMRRDPTHQDLFRMMALAPDWTESNVRSVVSAFKPGLEGELHRAFWGRVIVRGTIGTALFNYMMALWDPEKDQSDESGKDQFIKNYQRAWREGGLRWLSVDVTPIYRGLGGEDDKRKYFSLIGHFRDPVRWALEPVRTVKNKSSIAMGMALEALEGTDWANRPFTTWDELLGMDYGKGVYKRGGKYGKKGDPKYGQLKGQTVSWRTSAKPGALHWQQLPSYAANQMLGLMPIQVQAAAAWMAGEIDAFDAISRSTGFITQTTYPEKEEK